MQCKKSKQSSCFWGGFAAAAVSTAQLLLLALPPQHVILLCSTLSACLMRRLMLLHFISDPDSLIINKYYMFMRSQYFEFIGYKLVFLQHEVALGKGSSNTSNPITSAEAGDSSNGSAAAGWHGQAAAAAGMRQLL